MFNQFPVYPFGESIYQGGWLCTPGAALTLLPCLRNKAAAPLQRCAAPRRAVPSQMPQRTSLS